MFLCKTWRNTNIQWNLSDWTWSECQLVSDLLTNFVGIDARIIQEETLKPFWEKDKNRKKRFIKLICKVKNEEYIEIKEVYDDIKINVEDIRLVVKTLTDIKLSIN